MIVQHATTPSTRIIERRVTFTEIQALIAETLDVDRTEVTRALSLHDVPEWSSLDHVTLMLALEDRFGCQIDGSSTAELVSVQAIERFLIGDRPAVDLDGQVPTTNADGLPTKPSPTIYRGLDGVHYDRSTIAGIDGQRGELLIRGYPIEDLAGSVGFAPMCHLVMHGELPTPEEACAHHRLLRTARLPSQVVMALQALARAHPMVALRTAISVLGHAGPAARPTDGQQVLEVAQDLLAQARCAVTTHNAFRTGLGIDDAMAFDRGSGKAVNHSVTAEFLRRYFRSQPAPLAVEALDLVWALGVEHGSNASTFAARVAAASGADLNGAIVSAMSTFAGPLHGGAIEGVIEGLREVGSPENAAAYVKDRRSRRLPIMGFGHRVYKVTDPRVPPLRAMARRLADDRRDWWAVDTMSAVEAAMAPYERAGLSMNVDSYSAVIYHLLGFADDMFTTLYALTRAAGWAAHIAEQVDRNVLIRPRLAYVGPARRSVSGKDAR